MLTTCLGRWSLRTAFAFVFVLTTWALADDANLPPGTLRLPGHGERVYAIAFSPDGKYVVTGSFDRTIKLWDAATGKEIKTFTGHQNLVLSLAFHPAGHSIASGSSDNSVKLWDIPSSSPLRQFAAPEAVNQVALSPDGKLVAAAGKDGTIKLWATADGKQLFNLTGHAGPVLGVAFSTRGQLLASGGSDGTVRFWDTAKGQPVGGVGAHRGPAHAVVFHNSDTFAASVGEDGLLKFWQLPVAADRPLPPHGDAVTALTLFANGSQVLSASADKTVRATAVANGQVVRQYAGPTAAVTALASNGVLVAGGTADQRLFLWNAADGKILSQGIVHQGAVTGVAFHPQGTQLVTSGADGLLKTWPLPPAPGKEIKALAAHDAHPGGVTGLAAHPRVPQALSGGKDRTAKLWDLAAGKVVHTFGPLPEPVGAVAFNSDGSQAAAVAGKTVKVWNVADGKETATLDHPAAVLSLAFSADKTRLVTGGADKVTRVWDLALGKELQSFQAGGPVQAVVYHPASPQVIAGGGDKTLLVHPVSVARAIVVAQGPVRGLGMTPSGSHFLTGADDKTAKLWNVTKGTADQQLAGASGAVYAVAVARNGVLAATGGADKTVRVYTLADGKTIGSIAAPAPVRSLSFSPDNLSLAAACDNGAVAVWNVAFTAGQPPSADFGKPVQGFAHAGPAGSVVFAADNATLYSGSLDKTVKVWKVAAAGATRSLPHPNLVDSVAFDSTGNRLATGCHDGQLRIWDLTKTPQPAVTKAIVAHPAKGQEPNAIYAVAWTPDGKQVLSASFDRTLKLWDANSGGLVREFKAHDEKVFPKGHQQGIFSADFSPDGKLLVSGGDDRIINVWNVADGSVVRQLVNPNLKGNQGDPKGQPLRQPPQAHPGSIYGVRFVQNGAYVLSAGHAPRHQGYLALWSAADGRLVYSAELPVGHINSLSVATDGKRLAIACSPPNRQASGGNGYILKVPESTK